jgi:hypothetical protein
MSEVVTYQNSEKQCFCQIKFNDGKRALISIAGTPTPSVRVYKMAFGGLIPRQIIWEFNPTMAGGYNAYVEKFMKMFPLLNENDQPLDVIRDLLLTCGSIQEAQNKLLDAEASVR